MLRRRGRDLLEFALVGGLLAAFCSAGFFGLHLYNARLEAQGYPFLYPEVWIDTYIPLCIEWVWPYLSYYLMCFAPVVLLDSIQSFRRVALAYFIQFATCFLSFYLLPMRVPRPIIPDPGVSADWLRTLYETDLGYNIFPSLHTANAVMIALAFRRRAGRGAAIVMGIWAAVIAASTVLVKQHYIVDVVAGVALAVLADAAAFRGWNHPHAPIDDPLASPS